MEQHNNKLEQPITRSFISGTEDFDQILTSKDIEPKLLDITNKITDINNKMKDVLKNDIANEIAIVDKLDKYESAITSINDKLSKMETDMKDIRLHLKTICNILEKAGKSDQNKSTSLFYTVKNNNQLYSDILKDKVITSKENSTDIEYYRLRNMKIRNRDVNSHFMPEMPKDNTKERNGPLVISGENRI